MPHSEGRHLVLLIDISLFDLWHVLPVLWMLDMLQAVVKILAVIKGPHPGNTKG